MRRRHARTLALFLALTSVGCTEREHGPSPPPRPSAPPRPLAPPSPPGAEAWGCTLGEPIRLTSLAARPTRLSASLGDTGGWAVAEQGFERQLLVPIDARGAERGEARTVEVPTGALPVRTHVTREGLLLILEGPCVVGEAAQRCLHAVGLDPSGAPVGRPLTVAMETPIHTYRTRGDGASLWLARSHPVGPPHLDRFELGAGGVRHEGHTLGTTHDPGGHASEVLGLAVDGDRWAVLWRIGAIEDPTGEVVLSSHGQEHAAEPLREALVVDSFAFDGDALALIASFEFARAHLFRLGMDGQPLARPELLDPHAPVPPPFAGRFAYHLIDDGATLSLRRLDGAGDRAGPDLVIHPHPNAPPTPAAVVRHGAHIVVLYVRADGSGTALESRAARCPRAAGGGAS